MVAGQPSPRSRFHPVAESALEVWTIVANSSIADVYMEGGLSPHVGAVNCNIFDLMRHHGSANILCADGHVKSDPILANAATTTAIGTVGNTPSGFSPGTSSTVSGQPLSGGGSFGGISLNKGFPKAQTGS